MTDDIAPILQSTASDYAAEFLNSLTSSIDVVAPGAGSFFGLLVGRVIPNQRAERLARFATTLARRLTTVEGSARKLAEDFETAARRLGDEQRTLFMEGTQASANASSGSRAEQLAELVARGLSRDEVDAADQRRVLRTFEQMIDNDVILLCSYTQKYFESEEWMENNVLAIYGFDTSNEQGEDILDGIRTKYGHRYAASPRGPTGYRLEQIQQSRTREEKDALEKKAIELEAMRAGRSIQLRNLGLLEEKTGSFGRAYYVLSAYGALLLNRIGLLADTEQ